MNVNVNVPRARSLLLPPAQAATQCNASCDAGSRSPNPALTGSCQSDGPRSFDTTSLPQHKYGTTLGVGCLSREQGHGKKHCAKRRGGSSAWGYCSPPVAAPNRTPVTPALAAGAATATRETAAAAVAAVPGVSSGAGGVSSTCVAGSKRCDGSTVKLCDAAGFAETIAQTCQSSQSCLNGACIETCLPNTAFCKDGAVWKCDSNGASTRDQQCAAGMFCRVDGDRRSCSTQACTASNPFLRWGHRDHLCERWLRPTSGGVDCAKTKQACYGGQCRDVACSNGTKECQHGDVYLCVHNGTELSLLTDCRTGEVCDGDMDSCRAQVCDPRQGEL